MSNHARACCCVDSACCERHKFFIPYDEGTYPLGLPLTMVISGTYDWELGSNGSEPCFPSSGGGSFDQTDVGVPKRYKDCAASFTWDNAGVIEEFDCGGGEHVDISAQIVWQWHPIRHDGSDPYPTTDVAFRLYSVIDMDVIGPAVGVGTLQLHLDARWNGDLTLLASTSSFYRRRDPFNFYDTPIASHTRTISNAADFHRTMTVAGGIATTDYDGNDMEINSSVTVQFTDSVSSCPSAAMAPAGGGGLLTPAMQPGPRRGLFVPRKGVRRV